MEHFAFNYISRPCHRGQQSAGSCSCFGTRWLSVEVIKMRTKILWLMFNLNFSTAWLPILAQHLSAMVSTSALKRRLTISEFDYAKPTTFTHAKKQEKKIGWETRIAIASSFRCVSWSDIVECERVSDRKDGNVSRAQHVIKPKKKNEKRRKLGYARNFLLITVWNPWQFIR